MKILFVTPCTRHESVHELKFLRSFSHAGYDTKIFSFHYNEVTPGIVGMPNISVEYTPLRVMGKAQRLLCLHILPKLRRVIREFRPDVIHAGNVWNDSFLSAVSGYHPLVVMPYGSDVLLDPQRSFLFRAYNAYAFRHADWVTCDAERVKDRIISDYRYPAERISVIPRGVEVERIIELKSAARSQLRAELSWEDNYVVIMTRNHEKVYGIDVFLKAMEQVLHLRPEVRVLMVGAGSLHEQYRRFVEDRGLTKFFHFAGRVSQREVLRHLQAADLYVSTSYSDGTSVSLMEAMASELPVVVTDVPANLEWVTSGENGEVVPRGTVDVLAQKITDLSRSPERNAEYARRNLDIVRVRGNWKENFREFERIYHTLASSGTHRGPDA
jgi:glycosyltransferase involved in cell wall biosynthesis